MKNLSLSFLLFLFVLPFAHAEIDYNRVCTKKIISDAYKILQSNKNQIADINYNLKTNYKRLGLKRILTARKAVISKKFERHLERMVGDIKSYEDTRWKNYKIDKASQANIDYMSNVIRQRDRKLYNSCIEYHQAVYGICKNFIGKARLMGRCLDSYAGRDKNYKKELFKYSLNEDYLRAKQLETAFEYALNQENITHSKRVMTKIFENPVGRSVKAGYLLAKIVESDPSNKRYLGLVRHLVNKRRALRDFKKPSKLLEVAIKNKSNRLLAYFVKKRLIKVSKKRKKELIRQAKLNNNREAQRLLRRYI